MRSAFDHSPEFLRAARGENDIDLARLALELAKDRDPDLQTDLYLARLDAMAARARERCPAGLGPRALLAQVRWVLFVEEGLRGDDDEYYDPRNSYLNQVLDRRRGIPISLTTVFLCVAERVGLEVWGVNTPGHFLAACRTEVGPVYIDSFDEGRILDRAGCETLISTRLGQRVTLADEQLAPCPPRLMVARMLRNLKPVYLNVGDFVGALAVQRRLAELLPHEATEGRDLGLIALRAGQPGLAVDALGRYMATEPEDLSSVRPLFRQAVRDLSARN